MRRDEERLDREAVSGKTWAHAKGIVWGDRSEKRLTGEMDLWYNAGMDQKWARQGKRRIPEKAPSVVFFPALFAPRVAGLAAGAYFLMK